MRKFLAGCVAASGMSIWLASAVLGGIDVLAWLLVGEVLTGFDWSAERGAWVYIATGWLMVMWIVVPIANRLADLLEAA